ncbi:MAG: hypothetical protein JOZ47_14550 [Kutzneria sp.]|nr:hypothetical protein [Kutzneria sp.]
MAKLARATLATRLAAQGGTVALVPFLFGAANRELIPGTVLNRLLVDLGLTSAAARTLVARMKKHGQLASIRRGRGVDYRLDGPFAASFQRVRDYPSRPPLPWTGSFHAVHYHVPEEVRPFRDALRRVALLSGYGLLQQGVLISVVDHGEAIAEMLDQCPPAARVYRTRLVMDTADAKRAACHAWELEEVGRMFERHIGALSKLLSTTPDKPEPSARTLRTLSGVVRTPMTDTLREPELPVELLPPSWPGPRLRELAAEVGARFGPATAAYVDHLISTEP